MHAHKRTHTHTHTHTRTQHALNTRAPLPNPCRQKEVAEAALQAAKDRERDAKELELQKQRRQMEKASNRQSQALLFSLPSHPFPFFSHRTYFECALCTPQTRDTLQVDELRARRYQEANERSWRESQLKQAKKKQVSAHTTHKGCSPRTLTQTLHHKHTL